MPPAWVDSHPDRYTGMRSGDYGPFPIGGHIHFVRVDIYTHSMSYEIEPQERAACGVPLPDWRQNPQAYPITGVVDCPNCLRVMEEATSDS